MKKKWEGYWGGGGRPVRGKMFAAQNNVDLIDLQRALGLVGMGNL